MTDLELADFGEALSWEPRRLVFPGPWSGHIPFAFWLVGAARPRLLVELGTHTGNSYAAFCQAIETLGVPTRAYAVDTWMGDEHSGRYGDEVFEELGAFNAAHYGSFSTLVRKTFDEARASFDGQAIDVLHIDGMHTYEAVRHDYETWRDALSDRGVVLFHDTVVRERDFGVWKLWAELSAEFPSFEFVHSNGLGVLGVGQNPPATLATLFEAGRDEAATARIRRRFAARGALFQERTHAMSLQRDIAALGEDVATLNARLVESDRLVGTEIARLNQIIERDQQILERDWQLVELQRTLLATKDQIIQGRDAHLHAYEMEAVANRQRIAERNEMIGRQHGEADYLRGEIDRLHREIRQLGEVYRGSMSWRLTAPLRSATALLRRRPGAGEIAPPPGEAVPAEPQPAEAPVVDASTVTLKGAMRALFAQRLQAFLASGARLRLPSSETPDVSIVLILYNQAELTFGCLASIVECLAASPLEAEIVILDNGSTDATRRLLARVEGARIVESAENLHFLRGVNHAAAEARGRHLLLLNNDAQLTVGSLEAAVALLDADEGIGAVGGRIVLPDGRLQEAGSIVWRDGTCLGYGRGRRPDEPEFMFRRDVDYCSGAFLLTPRRLFEHLGRFDEAFAPAYYEETDYCLRLWEAGHRIVFDPAVVTLHFEFGSSADASDALALQKRNWGIFRRRHAGWLAGQHAPSENVHLARQGRTDGKRVLLIEDRVPKPDLGAGYPRSNDIVAELDRQGAEVTLFPMFEHPETWEEVRRSIPVGVEVILDGSAARLRDFLVARKGCFDAVIVCRPHNMRVVREVLDAEPALQGGAKLVYDAEAVFARRSILKESLVGVPLEEAEAERLVAEELGLVAGADLVLSVSAAESRLFSRHGAANVRLLGHRVEADPTGASFEERKDILFLGATHDDASPNADSLRWFAAEVLPKLRAHLGSELRLKVVGLNDAPSITALDGTALDLLGRVDDLKPCFERARIVVVPTRFAAGIPHKAHHAASLGVPIVATDLIAEQLGWRVGEDLLAASDPAGFAAACRDLYCDPMLWEKVRGNALERVREDCSPASFQAEIAGVLETVPARERKPADPGEEDLPVTPGYVGRAAADDFAAAVPFGYLPATAGAPLSCAAVVHIFYDNLAGEILSYLQNLPAGTDVFVSTDTEAKKAGIEEVFAAYGRGEVAVRVVPNRGRDIAPKLIGFRDVYERYELVLHLHSKSSVHDKLLAPWRTFLFETLLGSPAIVAGILDALRREPQLGMIFPQHYDYIRRWLDWGGNFPAASAFAERLGVELSAEQALDFPSGSMFWARSAALKPLLDLGLAFEDFPAEDRQTDGTLAHVIERMYAIVCEKAGFGWMKIARPELLLDSRRVVSIPDEAALDAFLREKSVRLTGPAIIPVRAEAPDVVERVSPELLRIMGDNARRLRPAAAASR